MTWSCICNQRDTRISRNGIATDGRTTTMLHLIFAFVNVPGSVHNSQVTGFGNICDKMEGEYLSTGAKSCVDSAFGNMLREYLYRSCQDHLCSSAHTHELRKLVQQYAFKDGWYQSDLEHVYETSHAKCKCKCFLLIVICFALTPWDWKVPLEGRKGGLQDYLNLIYLI